jgi:hypothetical protein
VLPTRLRHEVRALSGSVESFGEAAHRSTRGAHDAGQSLPRRGRGRLRLPVRERGATAAGRAPTTWSPPTGAGTSSPTTSIATTGAASASTG